MVNVFQPVRVGGRGDGFTCIGRLNMILGWRLRIIIAHQSEQAWEYAWNLNFELEGSSSTRQRQRKKCYCAPHDEVQKTWWEEDVKFVRWKEGMGINVLTVEDCWRVILWIKPVSKVEGVIKWNSYCIADYSQMATRSNWAKVQTQYISARLGCSIWPSHNARWRKQTDGVKVKENRGPAYICNLKWGSQSEVKRKVRPLDNKKNSPFGDYDTCTENTKGTMKHFYKRQEWNESSSKSHPTQNRSMLAWIPNPRRRMMMVENSWVKYIMGIDGKQKEYRCAGNGVMIFQLRNFPFSHESLG